MFNQIASRAPLLAGVSVLALCMPSVALAQSTLPAVNNINGKLSFGYLGTNGNKAPKGGYINAALSVPISHSFGAQIDLSADNASGGNGAVTGSRGVGLHLFYRDPDKYLLGVYAHRIVVKGPLGTSYNDRIGLEGEVYSGNWTFAGFAGADRVTAPGTKQTFAALSLDVDYYFTENTMMTGSVERAFDKTGVTLGVQHLYAGAGFPLAVNASVGAFEGDVTASIGVTMFFGNEGKTLKQINRTNDPRIRTGASAPRNGYFQALKAGKLDQPFQPNPKFG
ncbi:hypothetical protein [Pseudooceanicola sp. MF1-13]|uniref:hypothetical protein n=1 Tax=Pseudooceanicola sp. MF1-13 TaxID=3379095 RepID=UPI0038925DD8